MRRRRPHVALIVESSIAYGRGVLRGIARYLREHGAWSIFLEQRELGAELPGWIREWDGDGILTRTADPGCCGRACRWWGSTTRSRRGACGCR